MRRALLAAALVLVLVLSGCASRKDAGSPATPPVVSPSRPGCGPVQPAIVHRGGGMAAPQVPALGLTPCFEHTGLDWTYEPSIGILSDGSIVLAPARSDVFFPTGARCMGVAIKDKAASTWSGSFPQRADPRESCFSNNSDPFVHVDPATDRIFFANWDTATYLSTSADRGKTWTATVSGMGQTDHEMVFTGKPRTSSTTGYPNVVYECAFSLGALAAAAFGFGCNKSLDGGRTFLPGIPAMYPLGDDGNQHVPGYCVGGLDHGIADATGVLYIPSANCGMPLLAMSDDEGTTWTIRAVSDKPGSRTWDGNSGSWTSVAVDSAGTIYYAWIAEDRLPWLVVSKDHGLTWSAPVEVAAPGVVEAALVQVVAGGPGKVALSYLGSGNAPGFEPCADVQTCAARTALALDSRLAGFTGEPPGYEDATWDAYMAILPAASEPDPVLHSVRVSGDGSDPVIRGPCGPAKCVYDGGEDFVDLDLGPDGLAYAVFVDRCMADCVAGGSLTPKDKVQAVIAHLDGPSLWGDDDPNGAYP